MKAMKRCLMLAGVIAIGTGVALAASPHFLRASDAINFDNGDLTCSWKEAGLGNNQNITYVCSASATATYVCINGGSANPSAANKTTVAADVSAEGTFNSGKNGSITASLIVHPPGSGSFSCPPGQTMGLAQVSYTNVLLTDTTNGIASPPLADQTTGCLLPDVRGAC
ncbi:hypothetical protein [Steroidobacter agaridevorans]|nr:hypothetical protein [Steroidobacter agaridevorans]